MSIKSKGFLSPDVTRYSIQFRSEHNDQFALAEDLSETAQALMMGTRLRSDHPEADTQQIVALLLVRASSMHQGVVLMAERGMIVEARTLARASFETACCLTAVAQEKRAALDRLIGSADHAKLRICNELLKPQATAHVSRAQEGKIQSKRDTLKSENPANYKIADMARDGKIGDLYIFYRQLSGDAAHPGIEALERYYDETEIDGHRTIRWGPEIASADIPDTLLFACCFFIAGLTAANDTFGKTEIGERLGAHFTEYQRLLPQAGQAA